MTLCARPACGQEFERTCKGPQKYCRMYCRKKHYAEAVNKKSQAVIRIENRRFYERHQTRMQQRMRDNRDNRENRCECGRGAKTVWDSGYGQCAECAAMPSASEFLPTKGRPLKDG